MVRAGSGWRPAPGTSSLVLPAPARRRRRPAPGAGSERAHGILTVTALTPRTRDQLVPGPTNRAGPIGIGYERARAHWSTTASALRRAGHLGQADRVVVGAHSALRRAGRLLTGQGLAGQVPGATGALVGAHREAGETSAPPSPALSDPGGPSQSPQGRLGLLAVGITDLGRGGAGAGHGSSQEVLAVPRGGPVPPGRGRVRDGGAVGWCAPYSPLLPTPMESP